MGKLAELFMNLKSFDEYTTKLAESAGYKAHAALGGTRCPDEYLSPDQLAKKYANQNQAATYNCQTLPVQQKSSSPSFLFVNDKLEEILLNPNTVYGHKLNKIRAAQGFTDPKLVHEEYIITPEETEAYQLALKTEDEIYKSFTLTGILK
jgi:hypothetical protein